MAAPVTPAQLQARRRNIQKAQIMRIRMPRRVFPAGIVKRRPAGVQRGRLRGRLI